MDGLGSYKTMDYFINRPFHLPGIKIVTDCCELAENLSTYYGEFFSTRERTQAVDIHVEKVGENDFKISFLDSVIQSNNPIQEIGNIVYENTKIEDGIFALHAGAVSINQKVIIFIAPTSNGKTTLTTYFVQNGFDYVTDDCTLIDMEKLIVYPYTKPIHLRQGGIDVLKKYNSEPKKTLYLNTPTIQRYVFTPINCAKESLSIDQIIFIDRNDKRNEVISLKPADTMQMLMKSPIVSNKIDHQYIQFIHRLAKQNCKKILYMDMDYVFEYVKNEVFKNG